MDRSPHWPHWSLPSLLLKPDSHLGWSMSSLELAGCVARWSSWSWSGHADHADLVIGLMIIMIIIIILMTMIMTWLAFRYVPNICLRQVPKIVMIVMSMLSMWMIGVSMLIMMTISRQLPTTVWWESLALLVPLRLVTLSWGYTVIITIIIHHYIAVTIIIMMRMIMRTDLARTQT